MLSVFRCLAHWSLCSPLNGSSAILEWVAQQTRAILASFPEELLELLPSEPRELNWIEFFDSVCSKWACVCEQLCWIQQVRERIWLAWLICTHLTCSCLVSCRHVRPIRFGVVVAVVQTLLLLWLVDCGRRSQLTESTINQVARVFSSCVFLMKKCNLSLL